MVFHSHDPALHLTINIPLPHCPHINKIHLKTITELRRQDGLLCPFSCCHLWMLLVADKTVINEQFTQLVGGAVEHRTIEEGLVNLQVALSAMSLVDDIKDVKHVEDNAPRLLVLTSKMSSMWRTMPPDFLCLRMILSDPSRPLASLI
jgi:hypothetical protein